MAVRRAWSDRRAPTPTARTGASPETLDVYEPTSPPASAPAVVDIHGGGWVSGDANLQPGTVDWDVEPALVGKGWVFVSINYRLAPSSPWPAQLEDAKCAIRFLRAKAPEFHIDPTRIGVIGASAGGHLASMLGLTRQRTLVRRREVPRPVERCRSGGGRVRADRPDLAGLVALEGDPASSRRRPSAWRSGQQSPTLVAASPVTYVHPGAPPFLVIQGAEDDIVPPSQSTELVGLLKKAGDQATLVMVDNAGHGLIPTGQGPVTPSMPTLASEVVGFLTSALPSGH